MIRFYYTNSQDPNQPQTEPNKSLGGYVSSTPVPNDRSSALFGLVSSYDINQGGERIIAIAANNESQSTLNNLTFSFDNKSSFAKFQFALVEVVDDAMEQIAHADSMPFVGDFIEVLENTTLAPQAVVSELLPNQKIGIWVKRVMEPQDLASCGDISDTTEAFDLIFAWD